MLLLCAVLAPAPVVAIGLGELSVNSAINQRLDAEVALTLGRGERLEDVSPRIADRAIYERMEVRRADAISELTARAERNAAGRPVIRIRSRDLIREPILELILDVRWNGGRVLREYPLLLDLPDLRVPAVAPVAPVAPAAPAPRAAAKTPPPTIPAPGAAAGVYGPVQRGETLSEIARRLKPEGVGTPQMTVALFEANPHAFIGGNMNHLRWGTTLVIPVPEAVAGYGHKEARARQAAQYAEWLGKGVPSAPSPAVAAEPQPAAPQVQILAAGGGSDAQLGAALQTQLETIRRTNEQLAVENDELKTKLAELEQQTKVLAEQVLALPPQAGAEAAAPALEERVGDVPPGAVESAAPPPAVVVEATAQPSSLRPAEPWWRNPVWWVLILAALLGATALGFGALVWRRYHRWQYKDFTEALHDDAEAAERARRAVLEQARQRFR